MERTSGTQPSLSACFLPELLLLCPELLFFGPEPLCFGPELLFYAPPVSLTGRIIRSIPGLSLCTFDLGADSLNLFFYASDLGIKCPTAPTSNALGLNQIARTLISPKQKGTEAYLCMLSCSVQWPTAQLFPACLEYHIHVARI